MSSEFNLTFQNFECADANAGARWLEWIEDFELYLSASGVTATSKARRRAALLYCGGQELRRIYGTMKNDSDEYDDIKGKLTRYFEPMRNKRFERLKFRQAKQEPQESVDMFVSRLKGLARFCEYDKLDDEIIDQLVAFCSASTLRKRILEKKDITLEKVLEIARTLETVDEQVKEIERDGGVGSSSDEEKKRVNAISARDGDRCKNCRLKHRQGECPAKDQSCNFCQRLGHYERCCQKKKNSLKKKSGNRVMKLEKDSFSENESSGDSDSSDGYFHPR